MCVAERVERGEEEKGIELEEKGEKVLDCEIYLTK